MHSASRQAASAWPDIAVAAEDFEAALRERGIDPKTCANLPDLYLAVAAADQDPVAVREFDRLLRTLAAPVLVATKTPDYAAADLVQDMLDDLLVKPRGDGELKLTQYTGRGPLRAWLRTCAVNACLMWKRRRKPEQADSMDRRTPTPSDDPELAALKGRHREAFTRALSRAFAGLDARERNLLRYQYVDGLEQQEIARVYRVHPATISRWIAKARTRVLDQTREQLAEDLEELDDVWPIVRSRLDVSLRGLLKTHS